MKKYLIAALLLVGTAFATEMSGFYAAFLPSQGQTPADAFTALNGQAPGTIVSIVNGDNGAFQNYTWTGTEYVARPGEFGYSPENDPSGAGTGGTGGDPHHGGGGGGFPPGYQPGGSIWEITCHAPIPCHDT